MLNKISPPHRTSLTLFILWHVMLTSLLSSFMCGTICGRDLDSDKIRQETEAFEILFSRRMLKISWNDKQTNTSVIEKVNEEACWIQSGNENIDSWGTRLEMKSYCGKLLKEEWRAKCSGEERGYIRWVTLHLYFIIFPHLIFPSKG